MHESALSDLARSGISSETAERAGLFYTPNAEKLEHSLAPLPALVIPYTLPNGEPETYLDSTGQECEFFRVRYLAPLRRRGKKKPQRYGQPGGSGVKAYFPINENFDWPALANDRNTMLMITEGEKKALAASAAGFPCIGLGGVYNFSERGGLLDSLQGIRWAGRSTYICFDSDAAGNADILTAEARLTYELSVKYGANVHIMRLPPGPKGEKVGVDDYLLTHSIDDLMQIAGSCLPVSKTDAEVLDLNQNVCWVERDGMVLDKQSNLYMPKANFVTGSVYSTRKIIVPNAKGDGVKTVSVANEWLTHPHAERYIDTVFDPSGEKVFSQLGGNVLNLWHGFKSKPGDASPFERLTEYVFRNVEPAHRDFAIKLMAYKFQNPTKKPALAIVLLGLAGSGKSMWAKAVRVAAGVHGVQVPSNALMSEFNGWVETALIAVIDEAQAAHVSKGAEVLKRRISEQTDMLNEKYRVAKQVNTYTMYILTSNDLAVGAYDADDRRMFVVNAGGPHADGEEFYRPIGNFIDSADGPAIIANYLLSYDLKGWQPPIRAPLTPEKAMAFAESLQPVERLAQDMQTADDNVIALWISQSIEWANALEAEGTPKALAAAREIKNAMARMQVRPWYTAEELALMFPAISNTTQGRAFKDVTAGDISRQLRSAGVPYLMSRDDPRGFMHKGRRVQYLVIADPEEWAQPLTQADFERHMASWPSYADYAAQSLQRSPRKITKRSA